MLEQGKLTAAESAKLLDALDPPTNESMTARRKVRFLRVMVEDREDHVDIRVPISLISAGVKLGSVIPPQAQAKINESMGKKGFPFDLSSVKPENIEELIQGLSEMKLDVKSNDGSTVRIFCE
jgi:hypothetical protein